MNIKKIWKINWLKFLYYNFFSKKVKRHGKGYLIPYKGTILDLGHNSTINIHDGNFHVCYNKPIGSKAEAYILLRTNGILDISKTVFFCYGSTIEVHEDACISLGSTYINVGAVLLAGKRITIGDDVLISRDVYMAFRIY